MSLLFSSSRTALTSALCAAFLSAGLLSGCAGPASSNFAEASAPIAMAGPEENWANFAGAIDQDRPEIVGYMLRKGLSPNTVVKNGDPALVRAIRMDSDAVTKLLMSSEGIDFNQTSEYGETPLMLAAFKGNETLVRALLDKGASVNRHSGWTPLHYAAAEGHEAIVSLFLEKGAHVNARTDSGVTALYMAARKPSRAVVVQLLRAGAYRDLCNDKHQSPADAANRAGDTELAKYLAVEKCVELPAAGTASGPVPGRTPVRSAVQR
ncbi:MAG: ankyrin repeat domain-containing protein [Duodenibacillus sp.]